MPTDWIQAFILGVVQGITEFLPISSTGHLLLVSRFMGFEGSLGGTFEIFIQLGSVLAVIGYYFRDLLTQAKGFVRGGESRRFWFAILLAFIPAAIVGLIFRDFIKAVLFETPLVIAAALFGGGVMLIVVELLPIKRWISRVEDVPFSRALLVGVFQCLALIPGMSRSGSSMIGGLLGGMDRRTAASFSFYLAIPTLGSATIVDLLTNLDLITAADIPRLIIGFVTTLVVSWLAIAWLLRFISTHSFIPFGIYRIVVAGVIVVMVMAGLL